jgi:heat-inducible transcriptional repressor
MPSASPRLSPRRQAILDLIVGDYIRTAAPVASQQIARRSKLDVSPATIRNDMAELEEQGFINRPHASSGGIPADLAYRFYVERRSSPSRPSLGFEELVERAINQARLDFDGLARTAAGVLAESIRNVAVASPPKVFEARLKQLQLLQLHEREALLVCVLESTQVKQQVVGLPSPLDQAQLYAIANRLNAQLTGLTAAEMRTQWDTRSVDQANDEAIPGLVSTVVAGAAQLVADGDTVGHPYVDGLRHLLGQPEFEDTGRAREAAEVVEDEDVLRELLAEEPAFGEVRVIIGAENPAEQLRSYSVVTSRYGKSGGISGVVAVVGPTRMDYTQAVSSVRYVAEVLGRLVGRLDMATA